MRSVAATVIVADRLNGRVTQLKEQIRPLAASSDATVAADDRLNRCVRQLEERVHSLTTMSAAIADVSKKPAVAINPILQDCAEFADEANTGQRGTAFGSHHGADVIKNALTVMEKLGCDSTIR